MQLIIGDDSSIVCFSSEGAYLNFIISNINSGINVDMICVVNNEEENYDISLNQVVFFRELN